MFNLSIFTFRRKLYQVPLISSSNANDCNIYINFKGKEIHFVGKIPKINKTQYIFLWLRSDDKTK